MKVLISLSGAKPYSEALRRKVLALPNDTQTTIVTLLHDKGHLPSLRILRDLYKQFNELVVERVYRGINDKNKDSNDFLSFTPNLKVAKSFAKGGKVIHVENKRMIPYFKIAHVIIDDMLEADEIDQNEYAGLIDLVMREQEYLIPYSEVNDES